MKFTLPNRATLLPHSGSVSVRSRLSTSFNVSDVKKTKRKGQKRGNETINNNINNMNKSYDYTSYFTRGGNEEKRNAPPEDPLYNAEGRNCLPFVAGEETERNTWIPLKELPEDCRRVVNAWNRLHLKTFYGLYPALLEKVQRLLQKAFTPRFWKRCSACCKSMAWKR